MRWSKEEYESYVRKKSSTGIKKTQANNREPKLINTDSNHSQSDKIDKSVNYPLVKLTGVGDICFIDKSTGEIRITIPVPPVTKKNHSNIISYGPICDKCGRKKYSKLVPSTAYRKYTKEIQQYMEVIKYFVKSIDYPINLKCLFYCNKHYKGDLVGYIQAIQDILTENGIIEDDNRNIVGSIDGSRVLFDSQNPRTEINITRLNGYEQWNSKKTARK